MTSRRRAQLLCLLIGWSAAAPALAWEPFRSQNSEVLQGNEHLKKNQVPEAIAAYDEAAKRLPNEPGVHLDRGLALLKAGKLPQAREALRLATQGGQPSPAGQDGELRGKAHYNLGLTFLREADALAKEENHAEAQKLLREAVDAFKSSLRASPKNRDAAWNLELTRRRLLEQEKKQQEKQDQEKKKDEEKKKQEDEQQKQEGQDGQNDQDDDPKQDQPQADDAGQQQGEPDAGDQQGDPQDGQDAGAPQPEPDPNQQPQPSQGQERPQPALPEHMQKALDALEDSEENLQKHRAAMRARQRPRRVEKDW